MANRYWVGGTGNWSDTARWSATSGGAGGASVPGTNDAAIFNASSGTGVATLDSSVTIQTLTMTGYTGTLAFGTNTISLNSTGTVFTGGTGVTVTGTPVINITNNTATATTVAATAVSEANSISFNFTAGTYALTLTGNVRSLNFTGFAGTLSNAARTIYGNLTVSSGMTLTGGTNTQTFAKTGGTQNITVASLKVLDFPITFAGTATYSLNSAVTIGTTAADRNVTLTTGTLEVNSFSFDIYGTFISSGTGVRRIQRSGNGIITVRPVSAATFWNTSTVTNLTTDGNVLVVVFGTNNISQTISAGQLSEANAIRFSISSLNGTTSFTAGDTVKSLGLSNSAYTLSNVAITIYGDVAINGTIPTLAAGANAWTFAGSGTQTITTNGKTLDFPITFSGTGTYSLGSALSVGTSTSRTVTLTSGTLELNSYTFTLFGIFSSSGTGVRKIQRSSVGGKIVLSLNTLATVWNTATVTNLTTDGNVLVQLTGGGAVTKTISAGALTEANSISFQLSTTAGTVAFTTSDTIKDLTIDNNSFSISTNIVITIYGNLTIAGTSPTLTAGVNNWTFAATSSKTITTNGKTLDFPIVFNGVGGSWTLQSALTTSSSVTLTNGTFSAATYNVTIPVFSSNVTNTRTLNLGTGTWTISSSGLSWNINGTNLTLNASSSTILLTNTGTTTFSGGSKTYYNVSFTGSAGNGHLSVNGSNTFNNLTLQNACDLILQSTTTNTFASLTTSGATRSSTNTIRASTVGSRANIVYTGATRIVVPYAAVRDISANVPNIWYMVNGSVDNGNNNNIMFANPILYWIGGSGTWNASSNANWSNTSGGSVSSYIPDQYTDVIFDANSDSGAGFAVTVSTGAVCHSMTASGLDNNMTLSGSSTLTVYGSLSLPSTNFTQSYTGTLTFAGGELGLTITTNSNVFSAITFNGPLGEWTLQDALTTTGTAILTFGTLALGAFTFTCNKFDSNNSNTRAINFGTGRIVLTSSSAEIVWDTTTNNGLIISGSLLVQLTGGGATTKTISAGPAVSNRSYNFQLSTTSGTVTFTSGNGVKNLIIDNNSFTLSNVAITIYGDLTIAGTTPTLTAGTNIWTFAATTGTQSITTNGKILDFPITFNGVGGTWALQDALTIGTSTSRTVTLTNGTLDLNSYTMTIFGIFSSSNSNTRRIQTTGSGGKIVLSLNTAATVWSTPTVTNMTTDGNILVQLTGGGTNQVKTISAGALSEANSISFQLSNTASTTTFTTSNTIKNLTIDNNSFTVSNIALTIYGNLLIGGTTVTLTAGTNIWTFAATSGTKTITTNGATLVFPLTFNGVGGTWALQDALTMNSSRVITLTNGTFNLNNYTCTAAGGFTATGSGSKVLAHGTGDLVISLAGAAAFNGNDLGVTDGSAAPVTITNSGTALYDHATPFVSGASGSILFNGTSQFLNVPANNAFLFDAGNFTIEAWIRPTSLGALRGIANTWQLGGAWNWNVTSGRYLNFAFTNAASGISTVSFTGTTRQVTANSWNHVAVVRNGNTITLYVNGVADATTFNATGMTMYYYDGSAKPLKIGVGSDTTGYFPGQITNFRIVKGTAVYTANFTPSTSPVTAVSGTSILVQQNLISAGTLTSTGTGKINMTSATAKTFVGGDNSYNTLNQGGAGTLTISGTNTFRNITNSVQPATILFTAGTTNTFTNDFDLNGTSGNLITIGSDTPASNFTLSKSSGTVDVSFCSISDSIATGGAAWYAGTTSTNGGNNTGWLFTNFVVAATSAFLAFFFP